jgi:hypothetical protein
MLCMPESRSELITALNLHGMTNGLSHFLGFGLGRKTDGDFGAGPFFVLRLPSNLPTTSAA